MPFGIEQGLHPLHDPVGLLAPLQLDEGRHVAAGAVLPLERAVEAAHHHVADLLHEGLVARDLGRDGEVLGEGEVEVPVEGVAEDDSLGVAVLAHRLLEEDRAGRQVLDGKGHVLDDHRGADLASAPDRGEEPLADVPEPLLLGLPVGEPHRVELAHLLDEPFGLLGLAQELGPLGGPRLHEERARTGAELGQVGRHAGLVLYRSDRGPIHELDRRHRPAPEALGGDGGLLDVREEDERARLVRMVDDGPQRHLGDEGERALGAHHEVQEDVDGVPVVDEGVEGVAGGVLDPVLLADPAGEGLVGRDLVPQRREPLEQRAVGGGQPGARGGIRGVDLGAVRQHEAHALHGLVAVERGAAAHAGRVVGHDPADHAGVDRGRVGPDLAPQRRQEGVGLGADDARLEDDAVAASLDPPAAPAAGEDDQHRVGDGLAREARAGGAEGDVDAEAAGQGDEAGDLLAGEGLHDDLRHEPVEAGVGPEGEGPERVAHHAIRREERRGLVPEAAVGGRERLVVRTSGSTHGRQPP